MSRTLSHLITAARTRISDARARRKYAAALQLARARGIEDHLILAGAENVAHYDLLEDFDELPIDRQDYLMTVSHVILEATVPPIRATYGMRQPGDLPDDHEVVERFAAQGAAAAQSVPVPDLPALRDLNGVDNGPTLAAIAHREHSRFAKTILSHTLPEILIDLPEL